MRLQQLTCPGLALFLFVVVFGGFVRADSPAAIDAYWVLLHEDAVPDDLHLTAAQRKELRAALDELDLQVFPLRNRSAKEASEGLAKVGAAAKTRLAALLKPEQRSRLDKLVARQLGVRALQEEAFQKQLALTDEQRATIDQAMAAAQAGLAKLRDQSKGKSQSELCQAATAIQTANATTVPADSSSGADGRNSNSCWTAISPPSRKNVGKLKVKNPSYCASDCSGVGAAGGGSNFGAETSS